MADIEYKNGTLCVDKININDNKTYPVDNSEWLSLLLDSNDKIVEGVTENGRRYISDLLIGSTFDIDNYGTVGDRIKEQLKEYLSKSIYNSSYVNEYPHIFDGMAFKKKLLERNDDLTVLIVGDSLSAFCNQEPRPNSSSMPCQMICHNWFNLLWEYVNDIPICADRFDSENNRFIEVGNFSSDYSLFAEPNLPYWTADAMYHSQTENQSITRYSNSTNTSVNFSWNLDEYEKLHFIHRLDYRASNNVTITISQGNGFALVFDENSSQWVDANGYSFSQKIEQRPVGEGYAWTVANVRLKMKKATNATGVINITMSKSSDDGYFFYWGVEKWNGNRIIFVNSSRGGRECIYFLEVVKNDIIGRKPDLLIFQLVLINEYGEEAGTSHLSSEVVNHFHDFILGNRDGHENPDSLKNLSNNFSNFQMIAIFPNVRYEYFDDDSESEFKKEHLHGDNSYIDEIAPVTWNMVKSVLNDNDIKFIDMNAIEKMEALARGWGFKEAFNSHGLNSINGFTADTVHPNVLGSIIWSKHIAPIFDIIV